MHDVTESDRGIVGVLAGLYDVFVDWPGRLSRELPGLLARLRAVDAKRVLDVGCGTGRHVKALRDAGFEVHGADPSEDMLRGAEEHLGGARGLHRWALGTPPPDALAAEAPFDAVVAMGNVWPQVIGEEAARAGARAVRSLLAPGGLLLLGLKAFAVREREGGPYLPLLRREHEGRTLWFVRFVDFELPPRPDGTRVAGFHVSILRDGDEVAHHRGGLVRVWEPAELVDWLEARGWDAVRVGGRLDEPAAPPTSEDVFVEARAR